MRKDLDTDPHPPGLWPCHPGLFQRLLSPNPQPAPSPTGNKVARPRITVPSGVSRSHCQTQEKKDPRVWVLTAEDTCSGFPPGPGHRFAIALGLPGGLQLQPVASTLCSYQDPLETKQTPVGAVHAAQETTIRHPGGRAGHLGENRTVRDKSQTELTNNPHPGAGVGQGDKDPDRVRGLLGHTDIW